MFDIEFYSTSDGSSPVIDWLECLADVKAASRIADRLERIGSGTPGDVRPVGDGVWEVRCHFGPGYRVYYSRVGEAVVVLLCGGGNKSTQKRDIATAKRYLADYKGRST